MNVDSTSHSNSNECTVRSKYFCGQPVMDESLSDFQEKKCTLSGPKKTEKAAVKKTKPKAKKPPKKIRGQKDIRAVLNKKNELIKYSKDFDKVCKQSGVDVDSEQLQIAIALSKSLQRTETSDPGASTSLSTQERQVKIRTTLQEYGFKVPEIKISVPKSKKAKSRLHYKLISVSDSEKKQILSDKFAQVLFQTENKYESEESTNTCIPLTSLFGKATNVSYETLKSNDIFYVDKLLVKTSIIKGSLLRDWSEIPGRPPSPSIETVNINFDDIDCSQSELDCILSGTLEIAQRIIRNKDSLQRKTSVSSILEVVKIEKDSEMASKSAIHTEDDNIRIDPLYCNTAKDTFASIDLCQNENCIKVPVNITQHTRSCSPDIFDDDISIVDDSYSSLEEISRKPAGSICVPRNNVAETSVIIEKSTELQQSISGSKMISNDLRENILCNPLNVNASERKSNDLMEITDIIGDNVLSQKSQVSNYTKRKSNDFMEITEYEGGIILSQQTQNSNTTQIKTNEVLTVETEKNSSVQLSLRQDATKRKTNDFMEITECVTVSPMKQDKEDQCIDLTQIHFCERVVTSHYKEKHSNVDLTQSSYESDDTDILPFVDIGGKNKLLEKIPLSQKERTNDTNFENKNTNNAEEVLLSSENSACLITCSLANKSDIETNQEKHKNTSKVHNSNDADCTPPQGNNNFASPQHKNSIAKSESESFFEESSKEENSKNSSASPNQLAVSENISKVSEISVDLTKTYETPVKLDFSDDIDLTQSTDSSVGVNDENKSIQEISFDKKQLGKINNVSVDYDEVYVNGNIGDVSVDYDELFDNMMDNPCLSKSTSFKKDESNNTLESKETLSSSQNSEVFNISDNELDYSMQKSRKENFDIGGISVIDNISNVSKSKSKNDLSNVNTKALEDSYLPEVHMKSTDNTNIIITKDSLTSYSKSQPTFSKHRNIENILKESTKTPSDQKYIVKMNDVTPIVDYVSLTTPEITKELDKYGVKPLKRRRAVQLLTHIYNQTHPTIETCSDDIVSPSKRLKTHHTQNHVAGMEEVTSPKKPKRKSPRTLPLTPTSKHKEEEVSSESNKENTIYEVTSEVPVLKDLECSQEDWVFQKREKAKVHSCRVPLHIALHNYVSARRCLREAILRYDPINIDVIHKGLVANGYRYDPKDLLKYLDKKCITVKTADSNAKNKKHY